MVVGRPIAGLAGLLAAAGIIACSRSTSTPSGTPPSGTPELSVPIVDLSQLQDFLPFGFELSAGRLNPAYEFRTTNDMLPVLAAGPGQVVRIETNPAPQTDSELHIRPTGANNYLVIYDHLVALQVTQGQSVVAGQVLGRVGPISSGIGRTELQINRESASDETVAVCPSDLGTPSFNSAHNAAFANFPARGASVCLTATVLP